jgi:hypothetical protein
MGAILMQNPHDELREYLDRLIHRYLYISDSYKHLKDIRDWQTPDRIEVFKLGFAFFELVSYSLSGIVEIELFKFLSERQNDERTLPDWLEKAGECAESVKPTRYVKGKREPIKAQEYRATIDMQHAELDALESVMEKIETHRDKAIAHLDKKYFNNAESFNKKYPICYFEIDSVLGVVAEILQTHASCLFGKSISMEVESVQNVDTVLKFARAWMRARKDRTLIEKGFRPVEYERDEYCQNSGSSQA